jgi:integrase
MASIDKRPNGTWRVRWRETPGGSQKSKAFRFEKDAKVWRNKVARQLDTGEYVDPKAGRVSFSTYADGWLASHHGRPATVIAATNALAHAKAAFGDKAIATVRRSDVQSMVDAMKADGRKPGTIGLAVQHAGSVFRTAVLDDLIAKSPVVKLRLPKAEDEMTVPTTAQVLAVLDAADEWFRPAVVLGAGLGLRRGEAAGLTWDRVSFMPERTVTIDRQWARGGGFAPPKTAAAKRDIPASEWVLNQLAPYSPGPDATAAVVTRTDGHVPYTAFNDAWQRACKAAEVDGVRYHDLRHYFATRLIAGGATVTQVQRALGHAKASMTLDVYTGHWPSDEDTTRAAFDRALAAEDSVRTEAAQ